MERVLAGYKPERVYYYFEEIAKIPRNSFHEEKISAYLVDFAKQHNLDVIQDEHLNVIINKPAAKGYANRKKVILEGHMDMVCVKDAGVEHDFEKDGIELIVDGDYVHGNGTTLGADDANAVSIILAILEDNEHSYPEIQAIITTAEEAGMVGAVNLDPNVIDGEYLIGLDYSNNTSILVSCAGSCQNVFKLKKELLSIENKSEKKAYEIGIKNLLGGHSGIQIILERANAISVLAEILGELDNTVKYELASFTGGDKENTIPTWAKAIVVVDQKDGAALEQFITGATGTLKKEYVEVDANIDLYAQTTEIPECCVSAENKKNLLYFMDLVPNGLQTYLNADRTLAKSSSNLGVLEEDDQMFTMFAHSRANTEYQHDQMIRKFKELAAVSGIEYNYNHRIPAWEYDRTSTLPKKVQAIWQQVRGTTPEIAIFHAGVEPGVIIQKMEKRGKRLEAVNIGVHNIDVHSTRERMELKTLGEGFTLVQEILQHLD